ncbi:glycerol-3-phosphate 1-O-acyltransferase PlsY [Anaeromyxobacter terrae]|uniref:glycerol-3-phosphate 1-O-acyltransferase PlsY n=1 Tax=Anaeromyxobacter terrae TaxID=2925406 RepID=UPI001F5968E6|nr:glycerol-3-phosphate 1-O-acyltransferase PlsY [Anaeromyxobacter sp. SG22]
MSDSALGVLLVVAGYLAGSIPFGVLLGRLVLGVDVRTVGSGNIGATNVARAGGKKMGVVVLLLDAAKAIVPILVARALLAGTPRAELFTVLVALAAFVGHLFPVWLGFKGGKGVATGLGIFVVLAPWAALGGVLTYLLAYATTRISSVGSLAGTAVCAIVTFALNGPASPVSWAGIALAALIVLRHRENIGRLVRGEEKRMKV